MDVYLLLISELFKQTEKQPRCYQVLHDDATLQIIIVTNVYAVCTLYISMLYSVWTVYTLCFVQLCVLGPTWRPGHAIICWVNRVIRISDNSPPCPPNHVAKYAKHQVEYRIEDQTSPCKHLYWLIDWSNDRSIESTRLYTMLVLRILSKNFTITSSLINQKTKNFMPGLTNWNPDNEC